MERQKEIYIEKYDELVKRAMSEADEYYDTVGTPKEQRDYGEWISEAEYSATTEEVVGYYLETYPDDFLPMWKENTTGIRLTRQDIEVSSILERFWSESK